MEREQQMTMTNGKSDVTNDLASALLAKLRPVTGAAGLVRARGRLVDAEAGVETWALWIDADLAREMLAGLDPLQRSVSHNHVMKLVRTMRGGKWKSRVAPIWIGPTGLVDGQHRLRAIILASKDYKFSALFEVKIAEDRGIVTALDIGRKRGVADAARMVGRAQISSTVAAALQHAHWNFDAMAMSAASHEERVEVVATARHRDMVAELHRTKKIAINAGILAAAAVCADRDADAAAEFFGAVVRNEHVIGGRPCGPAQALCTWAVNAKVSGVGSGKDGVRQTGVRAIHAWNAWRAGRSLAHSRYYPDAPVPEAR